MNNEPLWITLACLSGLNSRSCIEADLLLNLYQSADLSNEQKVQSKIAVDDFIALTKAQPPSRHYELVDNCPTDFAVCRDEKSSFELQECLAALNTGTEAWTLDSAGLADFIWPSCVWDTLEVVDSKSRQFSHKFTLDNRSPPTSPLQGRPAWMSSVDLKDYNEGLAKSLEWSKGQQHFFSWLSSAIKDPRPAIDAARVFEGDMRKLTPQNRFDLKATDDLEITTAHRNLMVSERDSIPLSTARRRLQRAQRSFLDAAGSLRRATRLLNVQSRRWTHQMKSVGSVLGVDKPHDRVILDFKAEVESGMKSVRHESFHALAEVDLAFRLSELRQSRLGKDTLGTAYEEALLTSSRRVLNTDRIVHRIYYFLNFENWMSEDSRAVWHEAEVYIDNLKRK